MPIFYGLYVEDERLAAAFDIIRFFCEPNFFRRAHITVRGPYPDEYSVDIESRLLDKRFSILFAGPGRFSATQNTVFLRCDIPGIEEIWDKPDYGGQITPHLTFYDGPERGFGYHLLNELEKQPWRFTAWSGPLTKIATKVRAVELNNLETHQRLYEEIFGRKIDYRPFRTTSPKQRLVYVSHILQFIHDQFRDSSADVDLRSLPE
jgi:hypothetical protein